MNIEDRLREIIREELAPVLAALRSEGLPSKESEPVADTVEPLPHDANLLAAFDVLKTEQQRAAFAAGLPPVVPGRWLTTAEAADQLGLKPRTLETWRTERRGPAYRRFGRIVRYDRAVIEEHLALETIMDSMP